MAAQRLLIHIEIHYENEALFIGETNYQEGYFWLHQGDDLALDLDIREIGPAGPRLLGPNWHKNMPCRKSRGFNFRT